MKTTIKKLAILCSGGDSPGMNAAIRAAVRMATHHNIDVFGVEMGYNGLIEESLFPIKADTVANIIMRGGTILKTGRCSAFYEKPGRDRARELLNQLHIDGMIVLGGNGSFSGARLLEEEGGPKTIGIPATIDNDIVGTEYAIGFDTACNTALNAIDKIRDTAFSLDRNFIIEIMGRETGFLAADIGIACGAEMILIPEFPFTPKQIVKRLHKRHRQKLCSLIVAAEAGKPNSSIQTAEDIEALSGIKYKVCILGHIQRGGAPTVTDRKLAGLMGAKAVTALMDGYSKTMTAYEEGKIILKNFPESNATRYFNDETLLRLNEILCEI